MALWRNRLGLVKAEGTYGVNASPAATDALLFTELDIEPLALELVEREAIQAHMGNRPSVVAQRSVPVKSTVELAGSGTAGTAPRWGAMLKACGLSETIVSSASVTYAPVSSGFSSYTLDYFIDNGSRQAITGIRGTGELSLETGSIPTLAFDQMGIYSAPGALSRPTETYSAQASPVVVNADNTTVSVHGMSACMTSFSLNLGVEMVFRQLAGCTKQVMLTDRKPSGEIVIELPSFATKDFLTIASNQTSGAITWAHTGPAGNIITFTASNCAFDSPTFDESDGVTNITLPFRPLPTAAGNDEFTLALT